MAYEKQTWVTGDTITAEKLNHMEDGIAKISNYDLILHSEYDSESGSNNLTGSGLSVEELAAKAANCEPILVYYKETIETAYDTNNKYVEGRAYVDYFLDLSGSTTYLNIKLESANINFTYIGTENESLYAPDGYAYSYTYDSTTKEYTFTNTCGGD